MIWKVGLISKGIPSRLVCLFAVVHILAADVPFRYTALTRSCVVIPCSFQYQEDSPLTRGIWSKKNGGVIYHNGRTHVLDHFKDRTKILGNLNEGTCSLEIDDIKPFDNGPFCFHAERHNEKYKFNNSCVFIVMKGLVSVILQPIFMYQAISFPAEVEAGLTINVSCSVTHTCPSHPPVFSWSVPHITNKVTNALMPTGVWETTSTITFMAGAGDGVKSLNCTAISWRGKENNKRSYFTRITDVPAKKLFASNTSSLHCSPDCNHPGCSKIINKRKQNSTKPHCLVFLSPLVCEIISSLCHFWLSLKALMLSYCSAHLSGARPLHSKSPPYSPLVSEVVSVPSLFSSRVQSLA
uniref:Immunoglobulin V-set domain-containing protein n=1 Tax=Mola mola TaxID=94237 RepID=A0A3Q3X6G5_MOLML